MAIQWQTFRMDIKKQVFDFELYWESPLKIAYIKVKKNGVLLVNNIPLTLGVDALSAFQRVDELKGIHITPVSVGVDRTITEDNLGKTVLLDVKTNA